MLNKAILMGRLTRDPEIRYTQSNLPVVQLDTLPLEAGNIRGHCVRYQWQTPYELQQIASDRGETGRAVNLRLADASESLDIVGNGAARVDQGCPGFQYLVSLELDGSDLENLLVLRAQGGHFYVEGY